MWSRMAEYGSATIIGAGIAIWLYALFAFLERAFLL